MSQRLRLGNLRTGIRIWQTLNVCDDDPRIPLWTNAFQERALNLGRWNGTTQLVRFCLTGGCLVLPREVAVIEAAKLDGVPMQIATPWYQFLRPHEPSYPGLSPNCAGWSNGCGCGCGCFPMTLEQRGTQASFAKTSTNNQRIRFYPGNAVDNGKTIIVQGYDSNGNWVRTTVGDARIDGEQVTLAMPFVDTTTIWKPGAPTGVIKEVTQYRVLGYAVDATTGDEVSIADYQPGETEPMYQVYNIPKFGRVGCGCGTGSTRTLLAIVSLQNTPVVVDNDWLLFTNLAAYKEGLMAEKYYEMGDRVNGDLFFFGRDRPARNARNSARFNPGMGAIPLLEAESRKSSADVTAINMQVSTLNLIGFR
jgi:hypothetical protein